MNKAFEVFKLELYALVIRKSFWFGLLGVPTIAFLIYGGISWLNQSHGDTSSSTASAIEEILSEPEDDRPQGYVDFSGLVVEFPDSFDEAQLIGYANISDANRDLALGKISTYYVIADDYLRSGRIDVYTQQFNFINSQNRTGEIETIINFNLLDGDARQQEVMNWPLTGIQETDLSPTPRVERDPDSGMTFFLPYGVMMIFYISIMGSSGMLLNSVTKEKENRLLEILLVSTDARDLLLGKMIGLGIVGLFQVLVWSVSSYALLRISGSTFQIPEQFMLNPSIILWGAVFFIFGYLVYAALMAGVGAMVPGLREASQATTVIVIPMMIPMFIISALIDKPNGTLSTIFSLFPLTAPTTMMLRLAATPDVPLWQILLSIFLLIISSYMIIQAVAGLFRAQTMLNGQPFNVRRFITALVGKG